MTFDTSGTLFILAEIKVNRMKVYNGIIGFILVVCFISCKPKETQESVNQVESQDYTYDIYEENVESPEEYFGSLDSINYELSIAIDTLYETILSQKLDGKLLNLLAQERTAYNKFMIAQHEFMQSHIDDADMDGSIEYKYLNLDNIFLDERKKEFIMMSKSIRGDRVDISDSLIDIPIIEFDKTFKDISDYTIPVGQYIDKDLPRYSEDKDRLKLEELKKNYYKLIKLRERITDLLNGNIKIVYKQTTYSIQRNFMIQLKNEYEGLGFFGNQTAEHLIYNDCDYKELIQALILSQRMKIEE